MKKVYVARKQQQAEAAQLKQKALEPQERHCHILDKKVNILVEYPDYKNPHYKGPEGAIYCENIIECFQNNIECRYSGISPLYPDPFIPREKKPDEETEGEEEAAPEE
ncbi:MAG: hypothetical protein AB7S38_35710 [Vulcanimicrobiota bacterium]